MDKDIGEKPMKDIALYITPIVLVLAMSHPASAVTLFDDERTLPFPGQEQILFLPRQAQTVVAPGQATPSAPTGSGIGPRTADPSSPALVVPPPTPVDNRAGETDGEAWWEPLLQPLISGAAALLGALVGGWVARANMTATNNQRANEVEIGHLQTKLNEFYGRFALISAENKLIALEFKKRQGSPAFRTLTALLDRSWLASLSPADQSIVSSMVTNGRELRALIRERAGLVDQAVQPYVAKGAAHFLVLELAYDGKLDDDPERFGEYVYPKQLDGVIDLEIKRLTKRIALLLEKSDVRHGPMEPLEIPARLRIDNNSLPHEA
ncbi:hypothetical protein N8A98_02465 (plasmid) [Devosia neptuniae]|uniref:Uncharacterized protein n=1 Tax=Devosia neptuniae TaxID=191302 RepID=A0ABY6C714_9HYPH|nr:hypothetical protein [Devosia neptuniae]UXN67937.1 hypothetical protein N8A98_02465 [Devosia neptuniae]